MLIIMKRTLWFLFEELLKFLALIFVLYSPYSSYLFQPLSLLSLFSLNSGIISLVCFNIPNRILHAISGLYYPLIWIIIAMPHTYFLWFFRNMWYPSVMLLEILNLNVAPSRFLRQVTTFLFLFNKYFVYANILFLVKFCQLILALMNG